MHVIGLAVFHLPGGVGSSGTFSPVKGLGAGLLALVVAVEIAVKLRDWWLVAMYAFFAIAFVVPSLGLVTWRDGYDAFFLAMELHMVWYVRRYAFRRR